MSIKPLSYHGFSLDFLVAGSNREKEGKRPGDNMACVVQSPLDRVVHGVQLIGGHVAVLEALQPPQQDGQRSGHGEAELDVVTSCHREDTTSRQWTH